MGRVAWTHTSAAVHPNDGRQLFGFDQGGLAWSNKSLPELSDDEFLSLLAMPPGPNSLKPNMPVTGRQVCNEPVPED